MPTQPAILGVMRLGNFRLGYIPPALALIRRSMVSVILDGEEARVRARYGSISVHDILNDAPNTCAITFESWIEQVGATTPYRDAVLADAPAAYWSLDDASGAVYDRIAEHHGTATDITYGQPGALNDASTAFSFNGTSSVIAVGTWAAPATVEAWIKTTDTDAVIFSNYDTSPILDSVIKCGLNASGIPFITVWYFSAPNTQTATVAINDGNWHHVVFTRAGGTIKIYVDAILVKTGSQNTGNGIRSASLGMSNGSNKFAGLMDEVTIYTTALTLANVQAHYAAAAVAATPIYATTLPSVSESLRISVGTSPRRLLFAGAIQTTDLTYEGDPPRPVCPVTATDDTARANQLRPFGTWTDVSATSVAGDITYLYAPGFSVAGIEADLPLVDITFDGTETFISCLTRLATAVGGYAKIEDLTVYLFLEDLTDPPDDLDDTPGRFMDSPPIRVSVDDSQVITRMFGRGHSEALVSDVPAASTTLPVADASMYNPLGGSVIVGTTPDGAASQVLTYGGVELGGGGSLVGPGAGPTVPPSTVNAIGSGLPDGVYTYAYTFTTAAGESLPSPLSGAIAGSYLSPVEPPAALVLTESSGADFWGEGDHVKVGVSFVTTAGQTTVGEMATVVVLRPFNTSRITATDIPIGPPGTIARYLYRIQVVGTVPTGNIYRQIVNDNVTTTIVLGTGTLYSSSGVIGPATNTAGNYSTAWNQIEVTGIAKGPSGTTGRKLYRTVADGGQLKLHTTIANNTATTIANDTTADGSLGANAPTSDTSGLTGTGAEGTIYAGATSILTSGAGPFNVAGGYATMEGDQVIRYTGITENTLTGIPSSGVGAIVTTVLYGAPIVAVPSLRFVNGLAQNLAAGSPVHIWVQRDDFAAQAEAALRESTETYTSNGIHDDVFTDDRRGEESLIAICDARLAKFSRPLVTVIYATRDPKTKSGKTIHVHLTNPPIGPIDLTIQDVTINEIDVAVGTMPRYLAAASNFRYSLEDILRRLAA